VKRTKVDTPEGVTDESDEMRSFESLKKSRLFFRVFYDVNRSRFQDAIAPL
jgi:hypothetical protein